jgi:hypothetical protein
MFILFEIIHQLVRLAFYLAIAWLFFVYVAPPAIVVGIAIALVVSIVNYLRALRAGLAGELEAARDERPTGPEPAFQNYFFQRAFQDAQDIWTAAHELNQRTTWTRLERMQSSVTVGRGLFTWLLVIVIAIIRVIANAGTHLFLTIARAVHLVIVAAIRSVLSLLALYLRVIERLAMLWRHASFVCPHSDCYRPITLPYYRCPNPACGNLHRNLIPGSYGIWRRRCACQSRLRTSSLFGRYLLPAYCPHCERPLPAVIGTAMDVHVPIIGGPSTGKSTALIRLAMALHTLFSRDGRQLAFPDPHDEHRFEQERGQLQTGRKPLKTSVVSPRSFLVLLREPNHASTLLCLYDPAGELYRANADARRRQRYFSHATGSIFLIDPFSLPEVARTSAAELSRHPELEPSDQDPQDVYSHFLNTVLSIVRIPRHLRRQRLAIIVTKADAFDLREQLQPGIGSAAEQSQVVRNWLISHGAQNLVLGLEQQFRHTAYFAAILQGPEATDEQVLKPVRWVLKDKRVIEAQAQRGLSWRSSLVANGVSGLLTTILFVGLPVVGGYVLYNSLR